LSQQRKRNEYTGKSSDTLGGKIKKIGPVRYDAAGKLDRKDMGV